MRQSAGQTRSNFLDSVVEAFDDAEMADMTTEQLAVHVVLAGLADQETKEKLHELENPSVKQLRRAAKRLDAIKHEVQQSGVASIAGVSPGNTIKRISGTFGCRGITRRFRSFKSGSYPTNVDRQGL